MAVALNAQAKYAEAQPLFEKSIEIFRRVLTDDHPVCAMQYCRVAQNLGALGKYARAQQFFEKALQTRHRLLLDADLDTALICDSFGTNLISQAKYAQAKPLLEQALEIRRRLLTEEHPDTAMCYSNLAFNLHSQGKFAQAQPLVERALAIHRRLLSDDDLITANSFNNVATNLRAQGRYAQAQPLFEKSLEIKRRLLTDENPYTALAYHNLAVNLSDQAKHAEAQPFYEKSLEIYRRLLFDDHPDTARAYHGLGVNLYNQGKYADAQPLYEKALEIRRRLLPDEHPDTAINYNNLAANLSAQGKYEESQPIREKALEIQRRLFPDDHPDTATSYNNLAVNAVRRGKYAQAEPLFEKALSIRRRLLGDAHVDTAASYENLGISLNAQGKYIEAKEQWLQAAKSLDATRLRVAFAGLERAARSKPLARLALAALLARLGQPAEAWQPLEEDLGRGLLDELAARQDLRLAPAERARLRDLTSELERLDKLAEATPKNLDEAERANRFEELKRQRELASIALGEFQTKLVQKYGALAGKVASVNEIQAALPTDAALVAWVDIQSEGPNAADPDGEHWGVVVRSRGIPVWTAIAGTGPGGLWTKDDNALASRVQTELRSRPGTGPADLRSLVERLRTQRLEPLAKALGATADGLSPAGRLVVLPSRAMTGVPVEALLAPGDTRTVSYAPSATVFKYLREQARPDRHAGLLALGDPVYECPGKSSEPKPPPDHGLLVNAVVRGSNAANHGLKDGDVLLAYNGIRLNKKDDLKVVAEGDKPIPIEVWRDGVSSRRDVAPGKLGVFIDRQPAPVAIAEQRKLQQVLAAARSGGGEFAPLPGTRREVDGLAQVFKSDNRPGRVLLGTDASEPELDRLAASGELGRFGFIHLATHGVIDEGIPTRSA
ncbi:MAG: tetratricopeptide repeat protein, partial [Isosphaeraceae bacterium]